jgi:hypothetical protein
VLVGLCLGFVMLSERFCGPDGRSPSGGPLGSVNCKHHVFAQSSLCKIYFFLRLSRDSGGFGVLLSDDVPGCDRKGVSSDITT